MGIVPGCWGIRCWGVGRHQSKLTWLGRALRRVRVRSHLLARRPLPGRYLVDLAERVGFEPTVELPLQRFSSPHPPDRLRPPGSAPDHAPLGNQEQPRPSGLRHTLGGVRRGVRLTAVRTAVNVVLYPAGRWQLLVVYGCGDDRGGMAWVVGCCVVVYP